VGERSGPVETEAGTHIILVTDRREGTAVEFEAVRAELEDRLQRADARAELLVDVERLRDISFNAPDLAEPAEELGLEVQRADGITRDAGEGVFADARLRAAAFSDDVLGAGHNSDVIELDAEHFAVVRVAKRTPPAPLPLEAVRDEIASRLADEAARDAAREAADALLAQLEEGTTMEAAANAAGIPWQVELGARRDSTRLPIAVRDRLFAMPAPEAGAPRRAIVEGTANTTYVIEFTRLSQGAVDELPPAERQQLVQREAGERGGLLQRQFESALRERADVVVF
jgi:peptidyl-prolyl cis-trans isomerase D